MEGLGPHLPCFAKKPTETTEGCDMSIRSQLLKGVLDGCVLAIIGKQPVYGYELSKKLREAGLEDVSEGTVYPILLRLQKNGMIRGEMHPSMYGPNRKYYYLTEEGRKALVEIMEEWNKISRPVDRLFRAFKP